MTEHDHHLMAEVAQGNLRAYRQLVDGHINKAMRIAERMLGNRQDAEDVMQDVCLKIWREAPRWEPRAKFSTWLYRVVMNRCIDFQRGHRKTVTGDVLLDIPDDRPSLDQAIAHQQKAATVRDALQKLSDRQRQAIILTYYEDMGNQDAADSIGVSLGALQQLLYRARQNLKHSMEAAHVQPE